MTQDFLKITEERLDIQEIVNMVGADEAGAISSFIGTTRNNFSGKKVIKLEYEAYIPMAEKEMKSLCEKIRSRYQVLKIAIFHRIGVVPIREASVIIAISSDHRKEGLDAVHFAIDELKATVPIWKKEIYEDGQIWKQNTEFTDRHVCCPKH